MDCYRLYVSLEKTLPDEMMTIETRIAEAYDRDELQPEDVEAVNDAIDALDSGERRICENIDGNWVTHQWLQKAVLLYFKTQEMELIQSGAFRFNDKIPLKQWTGAEGVRVVPQALVRQGAFIEPGCILMPSFVNIGAYIGSGTMVDTWATVGSCAQVGRDVHLAGGVGIGGVLEPLGAQPVIIEDHAFVGSRCVVVEGMHVGEGAVLGAGVVLTASTKIIDVRGKHAETLRGRVPANSVVIPGTLPKSFPAGEYGVPCALIIGTRSESTDRKTSLTSVLREFNVPA